MLRLGMDLNEGVASSRALPVQASKVQLAGFDWRVYVMMRCFFHLIGRTCAIRDERGVDVTDLAEARAQALAGIQEFRQELGADADEWRNWTLTVTDATGRTLFSLPLDSPDLR